MSAHYLLLIITLCSGPAAATDLLHFEGHFRQWYAGYRELGPALLSNCSTEYEVFRAQSGENSVWKMLHIDNKQMGCWRPLT